MPLEIAGEIGSSVRERIKDILFDDETIFWGISGPDGLTRRDGDDQRSVTDAIVLVVTEQRLLFVTDAEGETVDAESLAYGDLRSVEIDGGRTLVCTTVDGDPASIVQLKFPLPATDTDTVDRAVRHLRWVGDLRSRVVACQNAVDRTAEAIRDHAAAQRWGRVETDYDRLRESLDRLIDAVQRTDPISDAVLAPELSDLERTLELALASAFVDRARTELERGRQLVDNEDYDQATEVLTTAGKYRDLARDRFDEIDDDFFLSNKQLDLWNSIDKLTGELDAITADLVRHARNATTQADTADHLAEAVKHLKNAFQLYEDVLAIRSGENGEIRRARATVGSRLVTHHQELADVIWDTGIQRKVDDSTAAVKTREHAIAHQERAAELAAEFQPDVVEKIETRRQRMERMDQSIYDTAKVAANAGDRQEPTPDSADASNSNGITGGQTNTDTRHNVASVTTTKKGTADRLANPPQNGGSEQQVDASTDATATNTPSFDDVHKKADTTTTRRSFVKLVAGFAAFTISVLSTTGFLTADTGGSVTSSLTSASFGHGGPPVQTSTPSQPETSTSESASVASSGSPPTEHSTATTTSTPTGTSTPVSTSTAAPEQFGIPHSVSITLDPLNSGSGRQQITVGEEITYQVVVKGATNNVTAYNLKFALSNPEVAKFKNFTHVETADSHSKTVTREEIVASAGVAELDGIEGPEVYLGTITVIGNSTGQTTLEVMNVDEGNIRVVDDRPKAYIITSTDTSVLNVNDANEANGTR